MRRMWRRIKLGLAALALLTVLFIVATALFWSAMSFVVAALFLLAGLIIVLLGGAFAGYLVWRRSRL